MCGLSLDREHVLYQYRFWTGERFALSRCSQSRVLLVNTDSQGHATLVTTGSSLELVCLASCDVVDSNTLRGQEAEVNAAVQATIPNGMPRAGAWRSTRITNRSMGKHPHYAPTPARRGRKVSLTLALTNVLPDDTLPEVMVRLLTRLKQVGLQATVLYLGKGFCSGEIITYLQRKQGGIRALYHGWGSFIIEYTCTDGTTAHLAMVDTRMRDPKNQA